MKKITPKHSIIKLLKVSDKGRAHSERRDEDGRGGVASGPRTLCLNACMSLICPPGPSSQASSCEGQEGTLLTLDWQDLFYWCSRWGRISPSPLTLCTCLSRLSLKRFVFGKGRGGDLPWLGLWNTLTTGTVNRTKGMQIYFEYHMNGGVSGKKSEYPKWWWDLRAYILS